MSEPFSYNSPPTSSGRPTTSTGPRPGTSNPFRQGTSQGPPPTYDSRSNQWSSYGYDGSGRPSSSYGHGYDSSGRPPPSSYGARPPPSSYGYGTGSSSYGVVAPGGGVRYPEDEFEEESDEEDVFAFLPPTTADIEEEQRRREEEERKRREEEAERVAAMQKQMAQKQQQQQQPHASTSSMKPITEGDRVRDLEEEERRRIREEHSFAFTIDTDVTTKPKKRRSSRGSGDGDVTTAHPSPTYSTGAGRRKEYPLTADSEDYGGPSYERPRFTYDYEPPVSPPSTESNGGSRAGLGTAEKDGFKMTRLDKDGRRRSVDESSRRKSGERERKNSEGPGQQQDDEKDREDESVTVAASLDGLGSPTTTKEGEHDGGESEVAKEEKRAVDGEDSGGHEPGVFGRHWQHFQPNPARYNSNSGPYKRHREYHYNQAYPHYAKSRGSSRGVASSMDEPSAGGSSRRRRKGSRRGVSRHLQPPGTAGTHMTAMSTATSDYMASSEYTHGSMMDRPDTGLNSLGYLKETSRSELDEYDDDEYDGYDGESREGSIKMEFDFDAIEDEDSPYPEVRASVSNIDDPDMPAMTIRMWVVGLVLCMASSAVNVFFNFRSPAPSIVPLVLLLLSYPIGKFLAFTLPITTYRIPLPYIPSRFLPASMPNVLSRILRPLTFPHAIEFSLNPGPWNIKEHVLVYIMANVAVGSPYALNAIVVLEVFYEFKTGYWFSLVLVLATQLTGFGLAGMCRRFLVWPASMVWPQNLVACTLLNTLHAEDEDDGIGMLGGPTLEDDPNTEGGRRRKRGMSRYKFFIWTTLGAFVFFFLPGYLFQALSIFSFVCWAAPNNVVVNQLFGVQSGLGMSMLTFDWSQITWIGSPLMVPWWAEVHVFVGFVLFYWILTPILYYTNSWQLAYFPISDTSPYDRFGNRYNIGRVLKHDDTFDLEAYEAYSPLFLPATYAVTYLLAFCLSTCVIVHTVLYHGHTLLNGFKKIRVENDDIHAKLMRNYPEVPDWWYLCAFGFFFALAIVAVEVWDTSVPVWALLLSVILPVIYILPSGFIYAMTGQGINLNILAQIIPGTLLPGQPLANMVFKAYSVQTLSEATNFVQDLKLGHYVKVPPRATFLVQMIATTLAGFIQVGVKHWIFTNVKDICDKNQPSKLTCPHNHVFFTASAIWGLIGPTRQFGPGSIYHPHLYAIVIGVFLPLPFWLWRRRYPDSWVKWVSTPVVLNGVSWIPPATGINYSSWFLVGFMFQYLVRKRNFAWWSKFNYVLSSALDSGTVIAVIVIFFTLQFPKDGFFLNWWGNVVHTKTADFNQEPLLKIPEGGIPWKN
ncbi:peptide transporter MTD1 [Coprinopsis cinerea AmutBmut pab1-1]|nr:peptide transporter MTD1 [Coprinopsis cinerea AmutBmut pab1-1]